ncbi:MAG: hypothetical protein ABSC37_18745 [Xanthobacteraceae bacterium]
MSAKKRATDKSSKAIGSDLKKVDAYVLGPKDYEEIPELTDEDFARATFHIGGVPVSRGRQSRINAALRKAAKLPKEKQKKA